MVLHLLKDTSYTVGLGMSSGQSLMVFYYILIASLLTEIECL